MVVNDIGRLRITKILGIIFAVSIVIFLSVLFFDVLVMLVVSLFIALIFSPIVGYIEKRGVPRVLSVLVVMLASGAVLIWGISSFIPKIVNQMNTITSSLDKEKVSALMTQIQSSVSEYVPFFESVDLSVQVSNFISNTFYNSMDNFTNIISSIFGIITLSVIVPFMTFFLLKDDIRIMKGILNILPNKYLEMSYYIAQQMIVQLGRFVRGWILDALFVGILSTVGLTILGIDNSISIGAIAGVGHLIPYFGPVIGGLPAIIISVIQFGDFSMLPSITIMFVIIYSLDNGYIQPNVFSKATDLHPLAIIMLILIGSQLLGVIGMLLAVPAATIIKTAAKEIYLGYKNYKIVKQ